MKKVLLLVFLNVIGPIYLNSTCQAQGKVDEFDRQTESIIKNKMIIVWQINGKDLVKPEQILAIDRPGKTDTNEADLNIRMKPGFESLYIYAFCTIYEGDDYKDYDKYLRKIFEDSFIFSTNFSVETARGKIFNKRMFYILRDYKSMPYEAVNLDDAPQITNLPRVLKLAAK